MAIPFLDFMQDPLLVNLLLGIIVAIMVYVVIIKLEAFGNNKPISLIISIVVGMLAGFQIAPIVLEKYVILPYELLGQIIIFSLPLFIIFLLGHRRITNGVFRKIALGAYIMIIGWVWFSTRENLSQLSSNLYLAFAGLALVAIVFDKFLHHIFRRK